MKQTINYWLHGLSLFLVGVTLFLNVSHIVITNESIVLIFIGILATFIVVGNYAQVMEIKNNTNTQIKDLESKTENKINNLNNLYDRMTETFKNLELIEKNVNYTAAETYRLYGAFCYTNGMYRYSCRYLIDAVLLYVKSQSPPEKDSSLLDTILFNLEPANWNIPEKVNNHFAYDEYLRKVNEFPDEYTQKQKIIDLLDKYKEEEKKVKNN